MPPPRRVVICPNKQPRYSCICKAGVVHQDQNNENRLVDEKGHVRLIDWGYAKLDSDRCAVDMGGIKRLDFSPFSVLRGQLLKEKWYKAVEDNLSTDTSLSKTEVLQRYDDALNALEAAMNG